MGVGMRVGTGPAASPPERGGKSDDCSCIGRNDVEKGPAQMGRCMYLCKRVSLLHVVCVCV